MTTADYLNQLEQDRQDLVDNLETQGISGLTGDETFTELVPEVLNISGGGGSEFTGHYDAEGLTQLGWTSEDIQYYQDNGVLWNQDKDNDYKLFDTEKQGTAGNKTRFGKPTETSAYFFNYTSLLAVPMIDVSSQTNFSGKFQQCYNLITIPLWNSQNATTMAQMFISCYNLIKIPLLNTSNVTDMNGMFNGCYNLKTIPLLDTSNVTNMSNMFYYCYGLREIPQLDTSKVTNMSQMFSNCLALTSVPYLDTTASTNMSNMFYNCNNLSDDALNNIMLMCANATNYNPYWKNFSAIGLSSSLYRARAEQLSNYQTFLDAGWTIGS